MAHVAILLDQDYEDVEFSYPFERLIDGQHRVTVLGEFADKKLEGKKHQSQVIVDKSIGEASIGEFDALVIPGGYSPDHLRVNDAAVVFTRDFINSGKPVAAICHGPQLLIEAGILHGRTVTSWQSVRTDLINAGAKWIDQSVVEDGNIITSRQPEDLEMFCFTLMEKL